MLEEVIEMYCGKCGSELNAQNICPKCSSNINNSNLNSHNEIVENTNYQSEGNYQNINNDFELSDNEMMAFFGESNNQYYINELNKYKIDKKYTSWNWPAFLFLELWCAYRKMYRTAWTVIGIKLLAIFLIFILSEKLLMFVGLVSNVCTIGFFIGFGMLANRLYMDEAVEKVTLIKKMSQGMSSDQYEMMLRQKGGTSVGAVIGIYFAEIGAIFLLAIFIALIFLV